MKNKKTKQEQKISDISAEWNALSRILANAKDANMASWMIEHLESEVSHLFGALKLTMWDGYEYDVIHTDRLEGKDWLVDKYPSRVKVVNRELLDAETNECVTEDAYHLLSDYGQCFKKNGN